MNVFGWRPRRRSLPTGVALAALLVGACVDADVHAVDASASERVATSTTVVDEVDGPLRIGTAAATPRGNTIAVLDAETDSDDVHVLVEACAAPKAAADVGVSLSFFAMQLDDGSTVTPIEPADAREPALRTHQLRSGTCNVGWLTFDLSDRQDARGRYLVFGSRSAATIWDLTRRR
jgi:hypothetical protein